MALAGRIRVFQRLLHYVIFLYRSLAGLKAATAGFIRAFRDGHPKRDPTALWGVIFSKLFSLSVFPGSSRAFAVGRCARADQCGLRWPLGPTSLVVSSAGLGPPVAFSPLPLIQLLLSLLCHLCLDRLSYARIHTTGARDPENSAVAEDTAHLAPIRRKDPSLSQTSIYI